MRTWISDKNAVPPIYHDLRDGRKTVATVRRVMPAKRGGRCRYQLIRRFVDIVGGAVGPVFPSLAAAKRAAEAR